MAEVQTRSETNGLRFFDTVKEAFDAASEDGTIWKISFSLEDERVRFVRDLRGQWICEPIDVLNIVEFMESFE